MKKHILEVDGIQKKFDERVILFDIYMKCETSEIVGLLGRNGSGKSTLLKIMVGLVTAPNKCIRINEISKNKATDLFDEISYLHQDQFIPNYLSVKKAISLSIDANEIKIFCEDEFIKSILNKKINQLSSGELRYLEIKIVLYNSSKFVLLDEPYNGLPPIMIDVVNELIKVNAKRKGIIITDHNYQNVIKISTRLVLIKDGKVHNINKKEELVEKGYLSATAIL
ncbi:ATP-binding cassette domain-containing protein [Flavobacterium pectinovorum]|uniref:ATP-binding cassette domain-containing protein n=1 Tax=Flavobacterium pectinovorum TaxID=29533 RepID=UPI001FAD2AB9|nr:ATP-binding cassette domain-containing protein [Flavobacterium pectinovorum]MCI9844281.1 ATP-binding cassette domain-containing protein [Flavobacterium pectinovorum]